MQKTIFLFSCQGSQYPGMGKEIIESFPKLKYIYELGSEIVGFDLEKASINYNKDQLSKTIVSQPAIFAHSMLCLNLALKNNITFEATAGHSLGEYAAMVASNIIDLETAFKIIKIRSELMSECCQNTKGGMLSVITDDMDKINQVCSGINGYILPVNFNSSKETVLSGDLDAIENAVNIFKAMKIKAIKLNVEGAFHSALMQPAALALYIKIKDYKFCPPTKNFYSNVTGDKLENSKDIAKLISDHIVSPVKFTKELKKIYNDGYSRYIELGPNKIVASFAKKTLSNIKTYNIKDIDTLNTTINDIKNDI